VHGELGELSQVVRQGTLKLAQQFQ
jgi:hypothetical protein